jgi:hypothetical protein
MKIVVLGAGAWGTALAGERRRAPRRVRCGRVMPAQVQAHGSARENHRYLPGVALPPGADGPGRRLRRAGARSERGPDLPSSPRRWPACAPCWRTAGRRARGLAVQGLRGGRPACWATRSCRGGARTAGLRRAVAGPASRWKSRGASPRRWSRPAPTPPCATRLVRPSRRQPARLHQRRRGGRGSGRRGQERAGHRHRHATAWAWG